MQFLIQIKLLKINIVVTEVLSEAPNRDVKLTRENSTKSSLMKFRGREFNKNR